MENKNGNHPRKIDESVKKTTNTLESRFALVSKMKITAWKAYLIIFFIAGLAAAIILSVQANIHTKSSAMSTVAVDRKAELAQIQDAIKTKNAKWVAKDNPIFQLSDEERKKRANAKVPSAQEVQQHSGTVAPPAGTIPATMDWRSYNGGNYVTAVKNQGGCGSCWAFGSTAALESYTLIQKNQPGTNLDLSEQTTLDCSGGGSCSGGYHDIASSYFQTTGIPVESCFPYSGADKPCSSACANWQASAYKLGAWSYIPTGSSVVTSMKQAIATNGPIISEFAVYSDFMSYGGGVYSYTSGNLLGYHVVEVVGYDDVGQYFIAKNSWGASWGESGYFRFAYSEATGKSLFGNWCITYTGTPSPNDGTPPSATIAAPSDGATISGTTSVNVSATDNIGVSKVEIYIDGTLKATDTSSPYTYSWGTATYSNGSHTISAKAYDATGNVGSATPVNVTVYNAPDNTAPTVIMSAPTNGGVYTKTMRVSATATDDIGVVSMRAVLENGQQICTSTSGTLGCNFNVAKKSIKGAHTVSVTASDAAGHVSTPATAAVTFQ